MGCCCSQIDYGILKDLKSLPNKFSLEDFGNGYWNSVDKERYLRNVSKNLTMEKHQEIIEYVLFELTGHLMLSCPKIYLGAFALDPALENVGICIPLKEIDKFLSSYKLSERRLRDLASKEMFPLPVLFYYEGKVIEDPDNFPQEWSKWMSALNISDPTLNNNNSLQGFTNKEVEDLIIFGVDETFISKLSVRRHV